MSQDILCIRNRTENWKTAKAFCRLNKHQQLKFVNTLVTDPPIPATSVKMELFWKGVRDYRHAEINRVKESEKERAKNVDSCLKQSFWDEYIREFGDLHGCILDSSAELVLKEPNYSTSEKQKDRLYSNLRGTEIDIVFETTEHLFIGEAKYKSGFGRDGRLMLVHQLIRQYVAASLLMAIRNSRGQTTRNVVPFLVVDCKDSTLNSEQVKFMLGKGLLEEENIKSWTDAM